MPDISISGMTLRTTTGGTGHPHMVVTGRGSEPAEALADLAGAAEAEAARIAETFRTAENHGKPDAEWRFEVVDIRLIPATHDVPGLAWMAYGTLEPAGATPWATGTGSKPSPYGPDS
jgi:hypothetical protein